MSLQMLLLSRFLSTSILLLYFSNESLTPRCFYTMGWGEWNEMTCLDSRRLYLSLLREAIKKEIRSNLEHCPNRVGGCLAIIICVPTMKTTYSEYSESCIKACPNISPMEVGTMSQVWPDLYFDGFPYYYLILVILLLYILLKKELLTTHMIRK